MNLFGARRRELRRPARRVPSSAESDVAMRDGLEQNSDASNYICWIVDLCRPHLGQRILEIGAGKGDFSEHFSKHSHVYVTEISSRSKRELLTRFKDSERVQVAEVDLFSPQQSMKFDSVVMINVLEHIEQDEEVLRGVQRLLNPGGSIVLYVPAHWLLYSRFDNQIGHFRRYTSREVEGILTSAGFRQVSSRYVNSIGAIGWFVVCRVLRRKASEKSSVALMDKVVIPVVRKVESRVRLPFGISVFATARLPG